MKIYVYDTYAKSKKGHVMHFDVFTADRDDDKAFKYAKEYLTSVGEDPDASLTQKNCRYCHSEIADDDLAAEIKEKGHFIYKMEGCPR